MSYQVENDRSRDIRSEVRILDTIAILLTTGRPGDVTTVALDKRKRPQLVLAKNGPPTSQDDAAAQNLTSVLTNPATTEADVFLVIMPYCHQNINKRIRNLHESLSQFLPDVLSTLPGYHLQSLDKELPHSETYRLGRYNNREPPLIEMIHNLFHDCISGSQSPLDPSDGTASLHAYGYLFLAASALSHSRFLQSLIEDFSNWTRMMMAQKLKRRLVKACRYFSGVWPLIKSVKRWFPDRTIPYRWADVADSIHEGTVEVSLRAEDALLRVPRIDIPKGDILRHEFPATSERWQHIVHPCVHAELRVILHLDPPSSTKISGSLIPEKRVVGCSKRSCLCCMLWIATFNYTFNTAWMTNESHGKPYANWALPDAQYAVGANTMSIDEDVSSEVGSRLRKVMTERGLGYDDTWYTKLEYEWVRRQFETPYRG